MDAPLVYKAVGFDYNGVIEGTSGIDTDVLALVDRLRASGYRTGLLSNASRGLGQYMHDQGIDKHFDVINISAETGFIKPQREAFWHLAADLGITLDELVYIDDSPRNLNASHECGFVPLLFESYEILCRQLEERGIRLKDDSSQ